MDDRMEIIRKMKELRQITLKISDLVVSKPWGTLRGKKKVPGSRHLVEKALLRDLDIDIFLSFQSYFNV